MTDATLQQRARRAYANSDPRDALDAARLRRRACRATDEDRALLLPDDAAALRARLDAGELPRHLLDLAALCGDAASRLALRWCCVECWSCRRNEKAVANVSADREQSEGYTGPGVERGRHFPHDCPRPEVGLERLLQGSVSSFGHQLGGLLSMGDYSSIGGMSPGLEHVAAKALAGALGLRWLLLDAQDPRTRGTPSDGPRDPRYRFIAHGLTVTCTEATSPEYASPRSWYPANQPTRENEVGRAILDTAYVIVKAALITWALAGAGNS